MESEPTNESPWTPARTEAALEFVKTWEGRPHRRNSSGPEGIDCIRLVIGALQAAGMLPEFRWPPYHQTTGIGKPINAMAAILLDMTHSRSVPAANWVPQEGDIGVWRNGRSSNHIGIALGGRFWHVTIPDGVHSVRPEIAAKRLQEVIRLTAPGLKNQPPEDLT